MMVSEIAKAMRRYTEGAEVITVTQFAGFIGARDRTKAKRKLEGLRAVDGKYYFIDEVAKVLHSRMV